MKTYNMTSDKIKILSGRLSLAVVKFNAGFIKFPTFENESELS
jgi:hypothetical protein